MKSYQCPNCGRIYNYGSETGFCQCMNCNYPLKPIEEVKNVKHPKLNTMLNDDHVIGTVSDPTKPTPKCPICNSTNLYKISTIKKATKIGLFGIFGMGDNGKTWKCNNCGSKF